MSIPTLSTGASTSRPMDRSAKTIFDERFVPTSDQYKPFDESEEAIMSARPIYEQFAYFLVYTYLIPDGQRHAGDHLAGTTVNSYLSTLINMASVKFKEKGSGETKRFFTCLEKESNSDSHKWLLRLKMRITQTCFKRIVEAGGELDHSETPVYLSQMKLINKAYSKSRHPAEAARRVRTGSPAL